MYEEQQPMGVPQNRHRSTLFYIHINALVCNKCASVQS